MKRSALSRITRTTTVNYRGESLGITYCPEVITDRVAIEMDQAADAEKMELVRSVLLTMVDSWDMEEDDGTPTPLSLEVLREFSPMFIATIWTSIQRDSAESVVAEGKALVAGLQLGEQSASAPNGMSSSKQPATSK